MKESDVNGAARKALLAAFPGAKVYKHADRFTAGVPDTSISCLGATTWLEFKLLEPGQSVLDAMRKIQLVDLMKLEQQCGRAWIIAYRKANPRKLQLPRTELYLPTSLLGGVVPFALEDSMLENVVRDLRTRGIARFEGFRHDAIIELIKRTH